MVVGNYEYFDVYKMNDIINGLMLLISHAIMILEAIYFILVLKYLNWLD